MDYQTAIADIYPSCNFRCVYCRNDWQIPKNNQIPGLEKILGVIDGILRHPFRTMILTGGEFFSGPHWREVLVYLKKRGVSVRIVSNAALLEPVDIPFLEEHAEQINVSFHAPDKKLYGRILGSQEEKTFDRVVNNLRLLSASRLRISVFFPPLRANFQYFFKTIQFLREAGIRLDHVNLNRIIPTQHTLEYMKEEKPLGYFEHKFLIEQLIHIREELATDAQAEAYPLCFLRSFISDGELISKINQPCLLGLNAIAFDLEGDRKTCPAAGFFLGDDVLAQFKEKRRRNPSCNQCPNWEQCYGGCFTSKGESCSEDTLLIGDEVDFREGMEPEFFDLLARLYKPFLSSAYKKARFQYTVFSRRQYAWPIGIIAVNKSSVGAHFLEIALVPGLREKYYSFLIFNKLTGMLPVRKYGWTAHKANYPSVSLLEKLQGGFLENTVQNIRRVEAEGFFKVGQPVSQKMQTALRTLKPQAAEKYRQWLAEFETRDREKRELQNYLKGYRL